MRPFAIPLLVSLSLAAPAQAQQQVSASAQMPRQNEPATPGETQPGQPVPDQANLPDIPTLMHQVEVHDYQAEAIEKNYIYTSESRLDEQDGKGNTRKTVVNTYEVFWLDGVPVRRHLSENGKPLSSDEARKENDRIDKEAAKARDRRAKADAAGKPTDPDGHDEITVARMLELGAFRNPRRILVAGRPTILIDYTGDPKAKTHNSGEAAFKELTGTVSIDETDKAVQHIQGRFFNNFKVGGGFLINVSKGTAFELTFSKVNDDAWFLQRLDAEGHARYLLFFSLNGALHVHNSNFRKFKATSTISPAFTEVDPASSPQAEPGTAAPEPAPTPQSPPR